MSRGKPYCLRKKVFLVASGWPFKILAMRTSWPMRRPLVPVALAGLMGTVMGLGWGQTPWIWLGLAVLGAVVSW
ncbi:MAG: hypothetical protein EBS97_07235, partial [Verrucomicrobia bacterium]|nr:hypothetical protein [Verrucomicrobiota bacterium]